MLRPTIFVRSRNAFVAHVARVCRTERVARAQANARATDTPLRSKRPRADAVTYAVVDRVVEAVFHTIHAELKTTGKFNPDGSGFSRFIHVLSQMDGGLDVRLYG